MAAKLLPRRVPHHRRESAQCTQILHDYLQKMAALIWSAETKDMFDGLADRIVLEYRPASRVWPA